MNAIRNWLAEVLDLVKYVVVHDSRDISVLLAAGIVLLLIPVALLLLFVRGVSWII